MASAGDALNKARSYLGFVEGPANNESPFGAWSGYNFQPWCSSFTSYILDAVGVGHGKIAYVPSSVAFYRNKGALFTTPQPGDLFHLYYANLGRYGHVGFVEKVDGDYVVTVEGNSNSSGSRTGGMVCRNRRLWRGTKTVFGRPAYTSPPVYVPVPAPLVPRPLEETPVAVTVPRPQGGYLVLQNSDGGVFTYDGAPFYGSVPGVTPGGVKTVDAAWTPSGLGYWILGADGGVFGFGDADYSGGLNAVDYDGNRKPIGIVTKGNGYAIVTQDPSGDSSPFDEYLFGA